MAFTHLLTREWSRPNDSASTVSVRETLTADGEDNRDVAVPAPSTDKVVNIAIDVSALASLFLKSDVGLVIKTNSLSEPNDTITLAAGIPLIWSPNCGYACPLSADVTTFHVVLGGSTAATLQVRLLQDATP